MPHKKLLFETDYHQVYLAPDQKYLGRCVIVLKRECEHLSLLTPEEGADFFTVVTKVENLFKEKFGATMFNWTCLMNNAYKTESPEKPQVHWHCRPRYEKPVVFLGKTYTDPNFAHHYLRGKENEEVATEAFLEEMVTYLHP